MGRDNYIDAIKEYLVRYYELTQYIANIKQDIEDCKFILKQEVLSATPSLQQTGGCSGGEKISQEERLYMQREKLEEKIQKYQADLEHIEPMIKRLNRSMEALASINETDAAILRNRYIAGMSWESTAQCTCCSVGFCRKRARTGLEMMAGMMFGPDAIPFQMPLFLPQK